MRQEQREFLKKYAEQGKISHAMIFCGSDAPSMKKIAVDFCKLICSDSFDILELEPQESGEIQISQIRELIWKLSLKSYYGSFKAAIINSAETMNQEAQNCLLKILEEPRGKAVLILISKYPDMLLPTIVSRVQKLRFPEEKNSRSVGNKKIEDDFLKTLKSDLALRFKYAKDLSGENKSHAIDILESWISYLRGVLISKINNKKFDDEKEFKNYSVKKIAGTISSFMAISHLMSTTNINHKLAIEAALLEI